MPSREKSIESLKSRSSSKSLSSSGSSSSIRSTAKINQSDDTTAINDIDAIEYESRIAFIQKQHAKMLSALHYEMEQLKRKNQGNIFILLKSAKSS